jgi:hypothetical protein
MSGTKHVSTKRSKALRSLLSVACLAVIATVVAPGTRAATGGNPGGTRAFDPAGDTEDNHCIAPSGNDWNELLDVSEQVLRCPEVDSGEFSLPTPGWFTNTSFEAVPEGFTPKGGTPMQDFTNKVTSYRYVVDAGTSTERGFTSAPATLRVIRLGDAFTHFPQGFEDFPFAIEVSSIPPQSIGDHSVDVFVTMRAMHCDGFSEVESESCLPAGETFLGSRQFTVRPAAAQSR